MERRGKETRLAWHQDRMYNYDPTTIRHLQNGAPNRIEGGVITQLYLRTSSVSMYVSTNGYIVH